jgi:integrase
MRPKNRNEYESLITAWLVGRGRNAGVKLNPQTLIRNMTVFNIEGVCEAFCGELTETDFCQQIMVLFADVAPSHFSHGLRSYVIPFAWWCGIISGDTMLRWKEMIPKYKPTVHVNEKAPSHEEVMALFLHIKETHDANNFASCLADAMIAVLVTTGCRRSQLALLQVGEDVFFEGPSEDQTIVFRFRPVKSYGQSRHVVKVSMSTVLPGGVRFGDLIYDWIEVAPRTSATFFCHENGRALIPQSVYDKVSHRFAQATGKPYSPQSLRTWFVSLIANTQSLEKAQHVVGHRHLSTTARYHNPYANGRLSAGIISDALSTLPQGEQR